jgi:hypothetical protein
MYELMLATFKQASGMRTLIGTEKILLLLLLCHQIRVGALRFVLCYITWYPKAVLLTMHLDNIIEVTKTVTAPRQIMKGDLQKAATKT